MKTSQIGITFLLILFLTSGCATTNNPNHSQETVSAVEAVEEQLDQIRKQLDETQNSLENVTNSDNSEIEDAYNSYSDNVEALIEMKSELNNRVENMRTTSNQYLSQWQSEAETYNNEDLRRSSERRRNELSRTLDRVMDNSGDVNRMLDEFISEAKEIDSYLANDLTSNGADAVASSQRNVDRTQDKVKDSISRMQSSVTEIKQEMGNDMVSDENEGYD